MDPDRLKKVLLGAVKLAIYPRAYGCCPRGGKFLWVTCGHVTRQPKELPMTVAEVIYMHWVNKNPKRLNQSKESEM